MDWMDGWTGWIDTPYTMTTRAPAVLKIEINFSLKILIIHAGDKRAYLSHINPNLAFSIMM